MPLKVICFVFFTILILVSIASIVSGVDIDSTSQVLEASKRNVRSTETVPSQFPCPPIEEIYPCECKPKYEKLYMDCTDVTSEQLLNDAFQTDFLAETFYEFSMSQSSSVKILDTDFNGVSFEQFDLTYGPFVLETVTENFFRDSADTVEDIDIVSSHLSQFPFDSLHLYTKLEDLRIEDSWISSLPKINSSSLRYFKVSESAINNIEPGTFSETKNLRDLDLGSNNISHLQPSTIPITNGITIQLDYNSLETIESGTFYDVTSDGKPDVNSIYARGNKIKELKSRSIPVSTNTYMYINFKDNLIETIEANAFYILRNISGNSTTSGNSSTSGNTTVSASVTIDLTNNKLRSIDEDAFGSIFPYVVDLYLEDNPLDCACEIAWILTNPDYLAKIDSDTSCASGVNIHDLESFWYENYC